MQTTNTEKGLSGFAITGSLKPSACLGLVLTGACLLFPKPGNLKAAVACPSLNTENQSAYAALSQDIRGASSVERFEANEITLAVGNNTVTYTYAEADHSLTRTFAGKSRKLLTGIDSFAFSLLHRAGPGAPLGTLVPASVDSAKAVACRWSCSRRLAGARLDSGSFHMAPVVMRNR
ncbi:MAG: hypothetical protein ACREIC_12075, partial [Limisphaerales bacterium]